MNRYRRRLVDAVLVLACVIPPALIAWATWPPIHP